MNGGTTSMWVGNIFREFVDGTLRREFPKVTGPCRRWHANGQLESESTMINGRIEGVVKEWHSNGLLKKEFSYLNGKVHGLVRQWNTQGTLLGEYELVHGVGIIRKWREDGGLESEIELFGEGCARGIDYDEVTGKARETYLWDGKPVNRKKFVLKYEKWKVDRHE